MSTTSVGRSAEEVAAAWLEGKGFLVLNRNWRTRWCELDIVAERNGTIHVIEVKYRRRTDFGTGFEYITFDKSQRLQRAALMWLKFARRYDQPYQIDVIAIYGSVKAQNLEYLPNAIGWD